MPHFFKGPGSLDLTYAPVLNDRDAAHQRRHRSRIKSPTKEIFPPILAPMAETGTLITAMLQRSKLHGEIDVSIEKARERRRHLFLKRQCLLQLSPTLLRQANDLYHQVFQVLRFSETALPFLKQNNFSLTKKLQTIREQALVLLPDISSGNTIEDIENAEALLENLKRSLSHEQLVCFLEFAQDIQQTLIQFLDQAKTILKDFGAIKTEYDRTLKESLKIDPTRTPHPQFFVRAKTEEVPYEGSYLPVVEIAGRVTATPKVETSKGEKQLSPLDAALEALQQQLPALAPWY